MQDAVSVIMAIVRGAEACFDGESQACGVICPPHDYVREVHLGVR
jgi:hypothetical protein